MRELGQFDTIIRTREHQSKSKTRIQNRRALFSFTNLMAYFSMWLEQNVRKNQMDLPNSLIHRYGPLSPPLFFFLMGIIGKGKMCRN